MVNAIIHTSSSASAQADSQKPSSLWARALSSLPEKEQSIFHVPQTTDSDTPQILNDILSTLEKQRDRCQRDKWKAVSIGGKEVIFRDVCSKTAVQVQKFMGVVDVAVSYDQAHAALPWAGVRFILQLCLSGFEALEAIVEGIEKAARLIAKGGILEVLI